MGRRMDKPQKIKLDIGTLYQKEVGGSYYYRYQVNGERKAVSLKTSNQDEAIRKAKDYVPVVQASSIEVISAHVKLARRLENARQKLLLRDAWQKYIEHPDRGMPATALERKSYQATFLEFVRFVKSDRITLDAVTPQIVVKFADYLRTTGISVSTHNRKILRLRRIFSTLSEYCASNSNPFAAKSLVRNDREEQENTVRRLAFTREQEQQLLAVLDDPQFKVMHKPEIKTIYYLGMFTGQRLKDCVLLKWDRIDLEKRRIWVKQFKTGKTVTIPIAPQLFHVLTAAQAWRVDEYVSPCVAARYKKTDKNGINTGNNLVNLDMLRVIRWIGLTPSVKVEGCKRSCVVYGFHSLRHTFASNCAMAGIPKAVVVSIMGADSEIIDQYYTHVGEEAQAKAISTVFGATDEGKSAQVTIKAALDFIESLQDMTPEICRIAEILSGK